MTLSYSKGDIVFSCDSCQEEVDTGTSSFEAARNLLYRAGWKTYKSGETWCHRCDNCLEKPRRRQDVHE